MNMCINESSDYLLRQFSNALLDRGLKQTQERFAILRAIIDIDAPFLIDLLRNQLLSKKYYVSRATLYNTMKLMEEMGIIDKVILDGKLYFEINRSNKNSYSIVNQYERRFISLDQELEEFLITSVETKFNISIKGVKITFFEK